MRVVVSGATGFIGRALVQALIERGDDVLVLSRRPELARRRLGNQIKAIEWTPNYDPVWGEKIEGYDAVVNLAGEPIFGHRWTDAQKERIRKSRTESAAGIIKAIRRADHWPETLISASGIGYYGSRGDEKLNEETPPGAGFLAEICQAWEEEVEDDDTESVRTVRIRIGMVLGPGGGALEQIARPFKVLLGGRLGSGRQWVSWIHINDLVGMILWALNDPRVEGPLNGTAPHPVTNREFARTLGRAINRPSIFPTPAFALRLALGTSAEIVLQGQRVLPERAQKLGYVFEFTSLAEALRDIYDSDKR